MSDSLLDALRERIAATGPLGVEAYMEICLTDPQYGYYVTRDPLGASGDFVTAPEISQMFGEVIGAWCAHMWVELGRPVEFALVEAGPGRGTLMQDILRTAGQVPGFHDAVNCILVEASPVLRAQQKSKLEGQVSQINWQVDFSDLPGIPTIIIANEFVDALPIRQLLRGSSGWHERGINVDKDGELVWTTLDGPDLEALVPPGLRRLDVGQTVEISPQRDGFAATIGHHLSLHPGAALIIDYGYQGPMPGDSFQAVRAHDFIDPLKDPGNADLTAHVDFTSLAQAARSVGARPWGPVPQGTLLEQLGIGPRAEQIIHANPERRERVARDLERLTAVDQMGTLFKALVIASPNLAAPPPFPPETGHATH